MPTTPNLDDPKTSTKTTLPNRLNVETFSKTFRVRREVFLSHGVSIVFVCKERRGQLLKPFPNALPPPRGRNFASSRRAAPPSFQFQSADRVRLVVCCRPRPHHQQRSRPRDVPNSGVRRLSDGCRRCSVGCQGWVRQTSGTSVRRDRLARVTIPQPYGANPDASREIGRLLPTLGRDTDSPRKVKVDPRELPGSAALTRHAASPSGEDLRHTVLETLHHTKVNANRLSRD